MACMVQFAPAMAAIQLARATHYEDAAAQQYTPRIQERGTLRLSWIAVTDGNGNRKLKMQWTPSADDR